MKCNAVVCKEALFLSLIIVLAVPLALAQIAPKSPTFAAEPSKTYSGWKTVTSKDGGFTIALPTTPTQEIITNPKDSTHSFVRLQAKDKEAFYLMTYADVLLTIPEEASKKATENAITAQHGTVIKETHFTTSGYTGLEILSETPTPRAKTVYFVRERTLVVGKRVYKLMANIKKTPGSFTRLDRFFNSFQILPADASAKP